MNYKMLSVRIFSDERGNLGVLEALKDFSFEIKRVYYIFNTSPKFDRGSHAHKELEQVVLCLNGSCEFVLDDGFNKEIVTLDCPTKALYIGKNMWREIRNLSEDCILVTLANDYYSEDEYIRDYQQFLKTIGRF